MTKQRLLYLKQSSLYALCLMALIVAIGGGGGCGRESQGGVGTTPCRWALARSIRRRTLARYRDSSGVVHYGLVKVDAVQPLDGDFAAIALGNWTPVGDPVPLNSVTLLAPVEPSKIVNFGWTFAAHALEVGGEAERKDPLVFLKPPTVITNPGDPIIYPHGLSNQVEYEGELAIIIGRRCKAVTPEEALDYVFGYTCFNDVTARDLTKTDPEMTRGKGFDTFGPLGPWIVTGLDPTDIRIITRLNGEVKQDARTTEMSFSISELISYISQVMTLLPGDVLASGTPAGSASIQPGDVVEVEIEGIGVLTNPVR